MKRVLLSALAILTLAALGVMFTPDTPLVLADAKGDVSEGVGAAGGAAGGPSVESVISTVVEILSWVVGILSVIMVIVGGFKYVISGGDSSKVQNAKNTLIYAIVGLVIAFMAQVLVRFVLQKIGG